MHLGLAGGTRVLQETWLSVVTIPAIYPMPAGSWSNRSCPPGGPNAAAVDRVQETAQVMVWRAADVQIAPGDPGAVHVEDPASPRRAPHRRRHHRRHQIPAQRNPGV